VNTRGTSTARRNRRDSDPPDDIRVLFLRRAQHIEERIGTLCETDRDFVRFVTFFAFMEVAIVLGAFLLVRDDSRFQLRNCSAEFVMRDDAALTEILAHNADEILGEILQHHHIRRGTTLESNQHDCSLFVLLISPSAATGEAGLRGDTAGSCAGLFAMPSGASRTLFKPRRRASSRPGI
jgi:hypothetical protein